MNKRSPNSFIVAITGGSVANDFCQRGVNTLIDNLRALPELADRRFQVVCLASPAFKQPQQLMAFAYYLSLGGECDLLINLDGFNEIAMYPVYASNWGIAPSYPHLWYRMVTQTGDQQRMTSVGQAAFARHRAIEWTSVFRDKWFLRNPMASVIWWIRHRSLVNTYYDATQSATTTIPAELDNFHRILKGPKPASLNEKDQYQELADNWRRSSLLLANLCAQNQVRYHHFIQPNQYIQDSKEFTEDELTTAFNPDQQYSEAVHNGYPRIQLGCSELKDDGISCDDLSYVFSAIAETLYVDSCCHFNEAGDLILAEAIARTIVAAW